MNKLILALTLLLPLSAHAGSNRYLRSVHCRFDNGVTIDGERPARDNQYSDFDVTSSFGFVTKNMRAMISQLSSQYIEFSEPAYSLDGGNSRNYYFNTRYDLGSSEVQDVTGTLDGWAGKTRGECRIQIMDGRS